MAEKQLSLQIAQILDDCRHSYAVHRRKIKDLSTVRSSSPIPFFPPFSKTLKTLFGCSRRVTSADRIVKFVSLFAARRDENNPSDSDAFLEEFLRFLLVASAAADNTARFRSCQIISEIIMRLPDDAEVSDELWDEVIDSMKQRVEDKISSVRTFAVRALARFASDVENGKDIVDLFLQALHREPSPEVRKSIILSLPPSNATSEEVIERTLDVSEGVRRAAYLVLSNKFPIQSLSIKQRTQILQRGLADRSLSVRKECLKLLKDAWLLNCCGGDPLALLRFLDVETYESVGEAVMEALLKAGMANIKDGCSIRQFFSSTSVGSEGQCNLNIQLMEAEVALYWRTVCRHLQVEAQIKGSDAATTGGTEAVVYAAEASDSNDLLERILPSTVTDYVELVKAHLLAGANYRFTSRQLLLLGTLLDFSDSTNRKFGGMLVQELLHRPLEHELDEDGNEFLIGDGMNLGGDKDWARAVSELAKKVHASHGEFDEVVIGVMAELAHPCRERTADLLQWMHCLAVIGLFLENVKTLGNMKEKAIEASELLHSLLIPAARHVHMEVQRVGIRCLGLFGLREKRPSEDLVKQLRLCFVNGPTPVSIMASKALLDLAMWHGPQEVDRAISTDVLPESNDPKKIITSINLSDFDGDKSIELLDLLYSGLDRCNWSFAKETDDHETVQAIIGEGFAKFLLLSKNYPKISASLHPLLLGRLIKLYFSNETKEIHRLNQCLSVFFEHYPALSADHKKCISKAFVPVMRSLWPGIFGNSGGASVVVSAQRKRATQASLFMLQMMQTPLYPNESKEDKCSDRTPQSPNGKSTPPNFDCGEEELALRIAAEVINCPVKKTAAEKAYMLALCRVAVLLNFRPSEQVVIKCMRGLLIRMVESVSADKELAKELKRMATSLKALDEHPDQELSQDQASAIFGKLELDVNLEGGISTTELPPTPAPRSTRTAPSRRRARREETSSDEEDDASSACAIPMPSSIINTRTQRTSKTLAMSRITRERVSAADDDDVESEVTSDDASDESEGFEQRRDLNEVADCKL